MDYDWIEQMKEESRNDMLRDLVRLVDLHAGRNTLTNPFGQLSHGAHTRDYPYYALRLLLTDSVHPSAAPGTLETAWTHPEYPEQIGGTASWRKAFEKVGYIENDRYARRPEEPLTLYSGLYGDDAVNIEAWHQMAWTSDIKIARWFADRFHDPRQVVLRATVEPERLYAHFTNRGESEYVINTDELNMEILESNHVQDR